MLTPIDLRSALADAVKTAGVCTRFCVSGIEQGAESMTLRCWHNSTGPSTTRDDHVYAKRVLEADREKLTGLLERWVRAAHAGKPLDLNAEGT